MTRNAESWRRFGRLVLHDLVDPFPGRLAQAWRIALICALTTMMAEVYGIPEAAISCFLVFFVMKPDAAEGSLLAISLTLLVAGVIMLLLQLTIWTIDVPALRIVAIAASSMILLYLASASKLGALGGIIALILAFGLTLLEYVPFGEAATRAILYAWLMATMPMGCILVVNLTMGRKSTPLLRSAVAERLETAADWLEQGSPESRARLREQVWEGQEESVKRWGISRLLALGRRDENRRLGRALRESYRLAIALLALPADTPQNVRDMLAAQARQAAAAFRAGRPASAPGQAPAGSTPVVAYVWDALRCMAGTPDHDPSPGPTEPFMRADARSNPEHLRYAIKTTAAAILCYFVYTAAQWQGIHTALITCYVAALGSVAETTHKLVLRISGCLVGAALGIGSIVFLMPHMESVGSIMLLVFFVTLLSGWIWVGDERVSYAGVQVALAFLLTVLQGFGPTFDMDTARDRIAGVLLGNCVLYIMFTQFWPVSVVQRVWDNIHQSLQHLTRMAHGKAAHQSEEQWRDHRLAEASMLATRLADTREALQLLHFESYTMRPSGEEVRRMAAATQAVRNTCLDLLLTPDVDPAYIRRLEALTQHTLHPPPEPEPDAAADNSRPAVGQGASPALERNVHRLETLIDGR